KARIAGVTFLAFELRGDANDSDDNIRLASGAKGVFRQIRRQPEEPRRGFPPAVEVLDSNRISMTSLKMNQRGHRARAMGRGVIDKLFSIQVNAITAVGVCTQAVVAVHRRDQFTSPANGVIPRGNAWSVRNIFPLAIPRGIHAFQNRSA